MQRTMDARKIETWLYALWVDSGDLSKDLIEYFADENISTCIWHPANTLGSLGVLLLGDVNAEVRHFIQEASQNGLRRLLVVYTAQAALPPDEAHDLLQAGAADVLIWKDLPDPPAAISARLKRWASVEEVVESPLVKNNLVGESRAWKALLRQIVEIASFTPEQSPAQARAPVLLIGETGTGKELVARLIHSLDPLRSQHELMVVDCTTIVPDLSGSELFGHERGAFTGAVNARDGALAMANHGTLFLDEVGELTLNLQVQLLRSLQEQTYKRVGSDQWRKTDFRLVAATNRDLSLEEAQGRFRRDLYYRLSTWTFRLPPLRERTGDILHLTRHFMRQDNDGREPPEIDGLVQKYLVQRAYPGNVRELKNLTARMLTRYVGPGPLTIGDLPLEERVQYLKQVPSHTDCNLETSVRQALEQGADLSTLIERVKYAAYSIALEEAGSSKQRAAARLGVSDRTLQMWEKENSGSK